MSEPLLRRSGDLQMRLQQGRFPWLGNRLSDLRYFVWATWRWRRLIRWYVSIHRHVGLLFVLHDLGHTLRLPERIQKPLCARFDRSIEDVTWKLADDS